MGAAEIIGTAASVSLLSGWRLYLCVFATGLAMRFGWLTLPEHLGGLAVLANGWVIGVAGGAAVVELLADKVMWIDSIWDAVHTFIRPIGGALLALAIVDPADQSWQVIAVLLGGSASLLTHGAKATARAVVNVSPEPVSNAVVSTGEDVATTGLLALALLNPVAAMAIAALVAVGAGLALWWLTRVLQRLKAGIGKAMGRKAG
jgi:hypothetical protein